MFKLIGIRCSGKWCGNAVLACALLSQSGCSSSDMSTEISSAASAEQPAVEDPKRAGLKRMLDAFVEGAQSTANLKLLAGNIVLKQSVSDFYGNHKRLVSWRFAGDLERGKQRVELHFDSSEFGPVDQSRLVKEERCYKIYKQGNGEVVQPISDVDI